MPVSQVFISYSHENQTDADRLRADIQTQGIAAWIDHESLIPGTPDWGRAIEDGISQCQALIYIASPAARRSPFVIDELDLAADQKIPVYPFWVEGARWRDAAPFGWSRIQYVDARHDYEHAVDRLLTALRANKITVKLPQSQRADRITVEEIEKLSRSPTMHATDRFSILLARKRTSGIIELIWRVLLKHKGNVITKPLHLVAIALIAIIMVSGIAALIISLHRSSSAPVIVTYNSSLNDIAAVAPDNIWAVGNYFIAARNNSNRTLIEHWDGSAWDIVVSPNVGTADNILRAVAALSSDNIWAVGQSGQHTLIEHWDGSSWAVTPSPNPERNGYNALYAVAALASNDIWAAGEDGSGTLIEHWDGSSWSVVPSPNAVSHPDFNWDGSAFDAIDALAPDSIWVAGYRSLGSFVEHWNGSTWTVMSIPGMDLLRSIVVLARNNIWAVGSILHSGNNITHWNGSSWTVVSDSGAKFPEGDLYSITALGSQDIWTVGARNGIFCSTVTCSGGTVVGHWNGSSWTEVSCPSPGFGGTFGSITALAPDNIWVVGFYQSDINNPARTLIENWNGTSWIVMSSPDIKPSRNSLYSETSITMEAIREMEIGEDRLDRVIQRLLLKPI